MKNFEQTQIGGQYIFIQKGYISNRYIEGKVLDLAIPLIPPRKGWSMSFKLVKIRLGNKEEKWFNVDELQAVAEYHEDSFGSSWETPRMKELRELTEKEDTNK